MFTGGSHLQLAGAFCVRLDLEQTVYILYDGNSPFAEYVSYFCLTIEQANLGKITQIQANNRFALWIQVPPQKIQIAPEIVPENVHSELRIRTDP